jgi:hypothetical protein
LAAGSGIRIRVLGWEKNLDPDLVSVMNIPDNFSESLEKVFWVKIFQFFDADPFFLIRDGNIRIRQLTLRSLGN